MFPGKSRGWGGVNMWGVRSINNNRNDNSNSHNNNNSNNNSNRSSDTNNKPGGTPAPRRSPRNAKINNPLTHTTVSFHNFKSRNFKLSVSNPKSKYVAYLSVLSQISNCQSLGRKNKHEILKTDRIYIYIYTHICVCICIYIYIYIHTHVIHYYEILKIDRSKRSSLRSIRSMLRLRSMLSIRSSIRSIRRMIKSPKYAPETRRPSVRA